LGIRPGLAGYVPSDLEPPAPAREFRGVWVATVANLNWPSKPGLTTAQQQAELTAVLDRAVKLKLNAVLFQVRPACDALYASEIEPWSEYLSGKMGQAPAPYYDPLAFAVQAAHQRGLELHAWFNPFRARHTKALSLCASNHISRLRPQLVKSYGSFLWLDPGEPAAREHSLRVILDVVKRYDIDGVHVDDYFYPYPERDSSGGLLDFPDGPSWARRRARNGGPDLARADWRRENINSFLQQLYEAIKAEKRWVKFGVSPFGIWRPGCPPQIRGFDAYDRLYADSRKWLAQGWLDYLAPQLYWPVDAPAQSFPVLLDWWAAQNPHQRHLWPGISVTGTEGNRPPREILNQVRLTRAQSGASGNIFWSVRPILTNRQGIADLLANELYTQPALPPACPWLGATAPPPPAFNVSPRLAAAGLKLAWEPAGPEPVRLWVLQIKTGAQWKTQILPARQRSQILPRQLRPDALALSAVDRCGNASKATVLEVQR
jgi:uncharacterized lipoprotein YddW (UPF0748 family)